MYDIKALYEAESVKNAIDILVEHPEATIIAGGSDVLIKMREGKMPDCELVSLQKLDELRGVSLEDDGTLVILPLSCFSQVTNDPLIQEHIGVLGDAVDTVGGPQLRNVATIGGNICNGVTSADSASTLVAWDAILEITGPNGIRQTTIKDFYVGPGKVSLEPSELLTAIRIPKASHEGYFGDYIKYAMRGAMDIATLGCSTNVKLSEDKKTIEDMRIAFGVAGPVPMRAPSAEIAAKGQPISEETIEKVAMATLEDVRPRDSWRASKDLRTHLVQELTRRTLRRCIALAGGIL